MFDLLGPLPTGTTVLEASAGTGKTFTIGALVTRYVAEGVARLDDLLVITFGRAASQELRERVREHLTSAERAFVSGEPSDEVERFLLDADPAELDVRHRRVRQALANFDAATIATTHQFCELVLRSLGVAGDSDTDARFVESLDEIIVDVVDDLYLQQFGSLDIAPFDRSAALALVRTVVGDAQAAIADADERNPVAVARVAFARRARDEVEMRKRRGGLQSFDDLLSHVATALAQPDGLAALRMRERWRIVLVDEFQDTDPVQWEVLDRAFTGHSTMVLIGDPKQAIYAFRGGDIATYLRAADTASTRETLDINWRSDASVLGPLNVILTGAQLGDPRITPHPVTASHTTDRLVGAPHPASVRIRQVGRAGFRLTKGGEITAGEARAFIARDCAADIAQLLASGATWQGRPVRPADVAVIVAVRDHGALVQAALADLGVMAVLSGGGDVFQAPAADAWLALLRAMEAPQRTNLVRSVALGPFFGLGVRELDEAGDEGTASVANSLRDWTAILRTRGVAAVVEAAEAEGLGARVLSQVGGERLITDLRHLGQLLHDAAHRHRLGLSALLGWFRDERTRSAALERPRRLESDAEAVQIVTIHGSKGLQYPITHLPFAYQSWAPDQPDAALFHENGVRTRDVSQAGAAWPAHAEAHRVEESGEELRKLYVALTRAQSQVVLWWAPTTTTDIGGLNRLLFGRRPGVGEVPASVPVRDDAYVTDVLRMLQDLGGPVAEMAVIEPVQVPARAPMPATIAVRRLDRPIDAAWRRTSYSGLVRAAEAAAPVSSEPDLSILTDEPPAVELDQPVDPAELAPIGRLPKGATFGSLVHAVLEHADPAAADLGEELRRLAEEHLRWWPVEATPEQLSEALLPVFATPLGPVSDDLTLGEIALSDRLRELDFEFPLAGGDHPVEDELRLRDLAQLLRAHLDADDPLRPYAASLEGPELGEQLLRGYLSGSIDVVLRLPSGRCVVVDYKTNFLGQGLPADYEPDRLREAMLHSHYPLQAILYSVVLHRYLSWRLSGYVPERHLGGVQYLYLRGMTGPGATGGVFSWMPPASLVVALSGLLEGARQHA